MSASHHKSANPDQVLAIDILRFVAAMLVLAYHLGSLGMRGIDERLAGVIDERLIYTALRPFTSFGWIGVEIFFVISGYVISISAAHSQTWPFVRKRFLRLAPAAWVCATATLTLLLLTTDWNRSALLEEWLVSVTLSPFGSAIDPAYWTIGIEVAFYGLVATQLRGPDQAIRLQRLSVIIGLISVAFAIAVQSGLAPAQPSDIWKLLLVQHGCFFALGMTIRTANAKGWTRNSAIFCMLLVLASLLEIHAHQDDLTLRATSLFTPPILTFVMAMLFLIKAPRLQRKLSGPKARHAVTLLGKTTYPLYLIHQTSGSIMIGLLLGAGVTGSIALAVTVITVVAIAMLIAAHVEPAVRAYTARTVFNRVPRPDSQPTAFPSTG
ncbi:MAG: acyltransferase [Sphingomonadales bacterium]|nr:acyltransferase [Sphingomonadales bacterium]